MRRLFILLCIVTPFSVARCRMRATLKSASLIAAATSDIYGRAARLFLVLAEELSHDVVGKLCADRRH